MLSDLSECAEIDFQQHRDNHQPDENRHRQIDLEKRSPAQDMEWRGDEPPQRDPDDDAKRDPEGQIAFENAQ